MAFAALSNSIPLVAWTLYLAVLLWAPSEISSQTVIEMDEDHVVPAIGDRVIEGDGSGDLGMRMPQTFEATRPGTGQCGHFEDRAYRRGNQVDGFQRRLAGELQSGFDRHFDVPGCEMEVVTRFQEPFV